MRLSRVNAAGTATSPSSSGRSASVGSFSASRAAFIARVWRFIAARSRSHSACMFSSGTGASLAGGIATSVRFCWERWFITSNWRMESISSSKNSTRTALRLSAG